MKVPSNFAAQVAALAESTPREAIAKLLMALGGRTPVKTRPSKFDVEYERVQREPITRAPAEKKLPKAREPLPKGRVVYIRRNPKRVGSQSWKRYKLYEMGLTAADCIKAGMLAADIHWDVERGFVSFSEEGVPK